MHFIGCLPDFDGGIVQKIKPTTELTVAGLVNKIRRLERLEDYPSFTEGKA